MTRVRRCAWVGCNKPATHRSHVTYLGAAIDRDPIWCAPHAVRADEWVRPGWAIVWTKPIEGETHDHASQ